MKKGLSLMLALIFALAIVTAVSANGGKDSGGSGQLHIGISMDAIESQFWAANQAAMKKALDSQGIKYTEVIADGDAQKQNQQIDTLIGLKVSAIIIAPKDGTAIVSAVKKCNDAGIPVIMDNRAASGGVIGCNVASDNKAMAAREMEWVAQKAKAAGQKLTLLEYIGNLTDVNAVYRHEGVTEVVKKYPEVFVRVIEIPTEWKAENADSLGQAALQANPDINAIFTASDMLIPTVKSSLQKFNRWYPVGDPKHVIWATFDGAADAVNEIKAGYIDVVSVQDSPLQGELCVKNAIALARGEKVDANAYDPGFEVNSDNWKEKGFAGF